MYGSESDPSDETAAGDPTAVLGELMRRSSPVGQVLAHELGLSLNDLAALHHLLGREPLGPAELAHRLGMSSASATVLADRLERAGYVRRRRDPADRRRIVLEVSEATAARSLEAVRPLVDAVTAVSEEFSEHDRHTIATYLSRVADALASFTTPPAGRIGPRSSRGS